MLPNYQVPNLQTFNISLHQKVQNYQNRSLNAKNQSLKKQKSISFHGFMTPTYQTSQNRSVNFSPLCQNQRSVTPKFHPTVAFTCRNGPVESKQVKQQQNSNIQLSDRKYSQIILRRPQNQLPKIEFQYQTKRQNIQNRIKKFQSLRSTITTSHANQKNTIPSFSKDKKMKKQSFLSELSRARMLSNQPDCIKEEQKNALEISQNNGLNYSPSDRSLDRKNIFQTNKFRVSQKEFYPKKSFLNLNKIQNQNTNDAQTKEIQQINKNKQQLIEKKKQSKFPSFLNSNIPKKKENKESFKPKQFPKFFHSNNNSQNKKQSKKIDEINPLPINKHSKSNSVLEQFKPKVLEKNDVTSTSESFKLRQQNNVQQIPSAFAKQKSFESTNVKLPTKNVENSPSKIPSLEGRIKHFSTSLRDSLTGASSYSKQPIKIERLDIQKNKSQSQIMKNNYFTIKAPQNSFHNLKKSSSGSQIVQQNKIENSSNQEKTISKKQKSLIIEDIKQTLIGCDLFSEEDYQNLLNTHKKDLLKSQNNKKNENTVKFNLHPSFQKKTSLKTLIDSNEQQENRFSSQQQKKLAQLAEMCEQKRSKWILEQTDTIKQSLKELSQFNTQKSLYDTDWKNISIKDFSATRNNRRTSALCQNIDQVREEQHTESKQESKISSIRLLSQDQPNQNQVDSTTNRRSKSYKNMKKSAQSNTSGTMKDSESSSYLDRLSFEDFEILWSSEQPFVLNKSTSDQQRNFISYGALHKTTNFLCSLKRYQKHILRQQGQQFILNFIRSLRMQIFNLDHPNIEKIYAVFSDKYSIYLVCEFTQTRLSQVLQNKNQQRLQISSQICIASPNIMKNEKNRMMLFKEIIDALQEIHLNHILHKSIHPNMIRIIFDTCKISGFTEAQMIQQSPNLICDAYVCPETLFDSSKLAKDIWCLGILAYQIHIGKKPFDEDSLDSSKKVKKILECTFDIPLDKAALCEQFLNSALKRNPKDRASIFDLKNIWIQKLKQNKLDQRKQQKLILQSNQLFQI